VLLIYGILDALNFPQLSPQAEMNELQLQINLSIIKLKIILTKEVIDCRTLNRVSGSNKEGTGLFPAM